MTQPVGFGKPKAPAKKAPSKGAQKRAAAATQYDEMRESGMPEYEIYIRVAGQKQWLPVGAIAVKRSNQVHAAIFANEKALLEGAFHRMPALKRNQAHLKFEYGYRLKEYKSDPIALAVRPEPTAANALKTVGNVLQGVVNNAGASIGSLFRKGAK